VKSVYQYGESSVVERICGEGKFSGQSEQEHCSPLMQPLPNYCGRRTAGVWHLKIHVVIWPTSYISIIFLCLFLFFGLVKAAVLEFPNVVNREGESAVLRCRAIGDPEPQMSIKKSNQIEPYQLGSIVSLDVLLFFIIIHNMVSCHCQHFMTFKNVTVGYLFKFIPMTVRVEVVTVARMQISYYFTYCFSH